MLGAGGHCGFRGTAPRTLGAVSLAALVATQPQGAASAPLVSADPVGRARDYIATFCSDPVFEEGWTEQDDLNGDRAADVLITYRLSCYDLPAPFCGPSGCLTEVWYARGAGEWQLVVSTYMLAVERVEFKGVPALRIATTGLACGKTGGAICESIHTFSAGDWLTLWSNADGE